MYECPGWAIGLLCMSLDRQECFQGVMQAVELCMNDSGSTESVVQMAPKKRARAMRSRVVSSIGLQMRLCAIPGKDRCS
jgi:hypothetical protein